MNVGKRKTVWFMPAARTLFVTDLGENTVHEIWKGVVVATKKGARVAG